MQRRCRENNGKQTDQISKILESDGFIIKNNETAITDTCTEFDDKNATALWLKCKKNRNCNNADKPQVMKTNGNDFARLERTTVLTMGLYFKSWRKSQVLGPILPAWQKWLLLSELAHKSGIMAQISIFAFRTCDLTLQKRAKSSNTWRGSMLCT